MAGVLQRRMVWLLLEGSELVTSRDRGMGAVKSELEGSVEKINRTSGQLHSVGG